MKLSAVKDLKTNVIAIYLLLLLFHPLGWSAPGDLDTSFDIDGIVITDVAGNLSPDDARKIARSPELMEAPP